MILMDVTLTTKPSMIPSCGRADGKRDQKRGASCRLSVVTLMKDLSDPVTDTISPAHTSTPPASTLHDGIYCILQQDHAS